MTRWRNTDIIVTDTTVDPEWAVLIEESVRQWDQCPSLTLTYRRSAKAPKRGVIVTQAFQYVHTTASPDRNGFIDDVTVTLAPISEYKRVFPLLGTAERDWLWFAKRSINHELGHCCGLADGGIHVDHWNADRTIQNTNCCMGSGNQVISEDFDLIAKRY